MALATGKLELRALHTVMGITYDDKTKLYTLQIMKTNLDYHELGRISLTTRNLILSAGSMGTTKLLVRARDRGELPIGQVGAVVRVGDDEGVDVARGIDLESRFGGL